MHENSNMIGSTESLPKEFVHQIVFRLESYGPRIAKCLDMLSETQVWHRPNEHSNSIANLIIHLCGNLSQYVIHGIGQIPYERNRDEEFALQSGYSKDELMDMLNNVVISCVTVIKALRESDLLKTATVQGFAYTYLGICVHVVEHYSYHTGQIAFYTKLLTDKDLGFYVGVDLNKD